MSDIITIDRKAPKDASVLYINGPIRGATSWQPEAAKCLTRIVPKGTLVAFNQGKEEQRLCKGFRSEYEWGIHHMRMAMKNGAVLFWFPQQSWRLAPDGASGFEHPYGRDPKTDLGICLEYQRTHPRTKIVIARHSLYPSRQERERGEDHLAELIRCMGSKSELIIGSIENAYLGVHDAFKV